MADPNDIAHLLRRTEFVARPARVAELSALSLEAAVDDVLDIGRNGVVETPTNLAGDDPAQRWDQYLFAYTWWVNRMIRAPRPLQEKLTLFWHGHFVSELGVVERFHLMMRQQQRFRSQALGNFRTLTQAMAIEPAMLIYLSNASNVKGAPNQNFARELMELFTLGIGNYTEDDVDAASRAWTGHNLDWKTYTYAFNAGQHDARDKTFFGVTRNWDGPEIIDHILRGDPVKQAIAARFIARKLWEFLAYPGPDAALIESLAEVFVLGDMELRPLLRALLLRPEFYSATARQGLLRTPTDWAVAICAFGGLDAGDLRLHDSSPRMGQQLFYPPNVAGWKSNAYWINTVALNGRAVLAALATSKMRPSTRPDDLAALTPEQAVDQVAATFGVHPLSTASRDALVATVRAERTALGGSVRRSGDNLVTMMLLTPEFNAA